MVIEPARRPQSAFAHETAHTRCIRAMGTQEHPYVLPGHSRGTPGEVSLYFQGTGAGFHCGSTSGGNPRASEVLVTRSHSGSGAGNIATLCSLSFSHSHTPESCRIPHHWTLHRQRACASQYRFDDVTVSVISHPTLSMTSPTSSRVKLRQHVNV